MTHFDGTIIGVASFKDQKAEIIPLKRGSQDKAKKKKFHFYNHYTFKFNGNFLFESVVIIRVQYIEFDIRSSHAMLPLHSSRQVEGDNSVVLSVASSFPPVWSRCVFTSCGWVG